MTHKSTITLAALLGFIGIGLGAFGAHALHDQLTANGTLAAWETAVQYHMLHVVGMLFLGIWMRIKISIRRIQKVVYLWLVGILLFSGSLYLIGLGVPSSSIWFITPIGGAMLMLGWLMIVPAAVGGPSEH